MKRRSRRSLGALAAAAAMLAGLVVTANPAAAASLQWSGAGGAGWSNLGELVSGTDPGGG